MQDPASPPKFRRTCPTCSRPVEPGNKFCATCGTQIPVLLTCRKCGTQFIAPVKYCDLCGATVIPGEVPEPDDEPEDTEEENTGLAEDQAPERDEEELPEPDLDEVPEDNDEENIIPAENETPHYYKKDIQEPDTDELLEQYGKDYGEDETLESFHKPKPPSPIKHKAKKPLTVPAPSGRESSEIIDDALFLSPKKPEAPAKPLVNKTRIIGGCMVLIAIIAAVYFIGLPLLTESRGFSAPGNPPAVETTPIPGPTVVGTTLPAPVSRALVPQPTQLLPSGQKLYFQVQKNPVTSKISVIFAGSAGEGSIKSADIKVTHPDGSVATGIIQPLKGISEMTLEGSKETDRVEIIAQMSNGGTYRVYDELVPFVR
jgi:predicted nucleic acid-binding Zn ribbon protein